MLLLFVTTATIGIVWIYYQLTFGKYRKVIDTIPGPPTLPLIGNVHLVGRNPNEILHKLLEWWRKYDKNRFRVWIGYNANIVISDAKDVEAVLSSSQILRKSVLYDLLHPWLGQGLLTSYGTQWQSHRKMITPSFHFKILVDFLDVMNKHSTKFMEILRQESKNDRIFDFQKLVCYLTLDVICDTAMGVNINALQNNDSNVVKAFQYMCYSVQMRAFSPMKMKPFLFQFTPEYKHYKHALNTLESFTKDVISKRREVMENSNSQTILNNDEHVNIRTKQAFLNTLLTATIDGRQLKLQEIYEEVSTFMFEGHDTTASGISFAVYLLSRHPEVQEKIYQEQLSILNGDLLRDVSYTDIQEMKYLEMFIKEAQRLYPSVPIIARNVEKPFDLNGTILPRSTAINILIIAMGYNDKYFPDPYKFDPERFRPENRIGTNPFEYAPFSAGPRNCIGQKFAQMEMKSVIAKIVRTFKILPPEDGLHSIDGYVPVTPKNKYDPILSSVLTLKSDNGIQIRMQERSV